MHKERPEAIVLLVVGKVLTYEERYGGTDIIILGNTINATNYTKKPETINKHEYTVFYFTNIIININTMQAKP